MLKIPLKFQHEVVNGFTFLRCVPKIVPISITISSRSMLPFLVRTASLRLTTEKMVKMGVPYNRYYFLLPGKQRGNSCIF